MNALIEQHEEKRITTTDQERLNQESHEGLQSPDSQSPDRNVPLFSSEESQQFRTRWQQIQGSFVDEPRHAVEEADSLVADTIKRLSEVFTTERSRMEHEWGQGQDVSTEDLRQALRRYRSFFDRLLAV